MTLPKLPSLWFWLKLGQVLIRRDEKVNPLDFPDDAFNYIGLENIEGHTGQLVRTVSKTLGSDIKSVKNKFYRGDILYGKLRPALNKVYLAPDEGICSSDILVLKTNNNLVNTDFIAYYLRSNIVNRRLSQLAVGGQLPRVSYDAFELTPIPIPPLPEQEKIVSILTQADELRQLWNDNLALIEKTTISLFWNYFGNYFTKNGIKDEIRLGQYIKDSQYGSSDSVKDYGKVSALRMNNITLNGWMDIEDLKFFDISDNELLSYSLKRGDILFNRTNSKELVGKTGLLEKDYNGFSFASYLIRIRLKEGLFSEYVWALLNSEYGKKKLFNMAKQAGNMANINATELGTIAIPMPDITLQQKFAKSIDEIKNIRTETIKTVNDFDLLAENLCAQAFAGELTEYWRLNNQAELETAAKKRDAALGISKKKVTVKEQTPEERPWLSQPNRRWLMDQLSNFQRSVYSALIKWEDTLIPSEDLETFYEQTFPVEHLEDANNQILRTLGQLAGLGLIAKISLYNYEGDYVTAFRGLREEELSQVSDKQYLAKG